MVYDFFLILVDDFFQETEADRSSHMTSDDEQKLTSEIDEEGNKVLPAGKHLSNHLLNH